MLEVNNLSLELKVNEEWKSAISPLSFQLAKGKIMGVIGESGSGKSLLAKSIMNILPSRARVASGRITLSGTDLLSLSAKDRRQVYGKHMSYIFQNPAGALNPVLTIGDQLLDSIAAHEKLPKKMAINKALDSLLEVGIRDPERVFHAYPHEISGGMKQRAVIAAAVIHQPDVLIADEATTALDATIRKQILDLFRTLCAKKNISILYISHDISAVRYVANNILVLYGGQLLETGDSQSVLNRPEHPYTYDLLQAVPYHVKQGEKLRGIPGHVPPITSKPAGCIYAARCQLATSWCRSRAITISTEVKSEFRHQYACHFPMSQSLGLEVGGGIG
jgi:peptide/nickel transport system ATP-binding protein